jgi:hydrogenase small subunit
MDVALAAPRFHLAIWGEATAVTGNTEAPPDETVVHVLWINAGLSCDGDSVALTAATQPSIEEIALGALPGLPKIAVHWPLIDFECGPVGGADDFISGSSRPMAIG